MILRPASLAQLLLVACLASAGSPHAMGGDSFYDGVLDPANLDGSNGFTIHGSGAFPRLGLRVSDAGDVNGDGVADVILGSPQASPDGRENAGSSVVLFGSPGLGGQADIYLADASSWDGFSLNGINEGDRAGVAVAGVGDLNGDGFDDLLLGATGVDVQPSISFSHGEAYVVLGGPGHESVSAIEIAGLNGSNGFALSATVPSPSGAYLGYSVSRAGDVNDDGWSDLIIGAPHTGHPLGFNEAGRSYVLFGGPDLMSEEKIDLSTLNGTNGFALHGGYNQHSGYSVNSAGDVNDDGVDDLLIGTGQGDHGVYVVFGGAGVGATGLIDLLSLDGSNGFVLRQTNDPDYNQWTVSNAGDVNGDGVDDLILGSPIKDWEGHSAAGAAYVVFGGSAVGSEGLVDLTSLDGMNGFAVYGSKTFGFLGNSVGLAGDVNGDGVDDLLIGAYNEGGNRLLGNPGQGYVLFGGASVGGEGIRDVTSLDSSEGFVVTGATGDLLGLSVSAAGDLNHDGVDDLILGAAGGNSSSNLPPGKAYVIFGRRTNEGDHNGDGVVDAADYTVWRDGGSPNGRTPYDFDAWAANYGTLADAPPLSVPEPGASVLLLITLLHGGRGGRSAARR